jgi:hypothetical protein
MYVWPLKFVASHFWQAFHRLRHRFPDKCPFGESDFIRAVSRVQVRTRLNPATNETNDNISHLPLLASKWSRISNYLLTNIRRQEEWARSRPSYYNAPAAGASRNQSSSPHTDRALQSAELALEQTSGDSCGRMVALHEPSSAQPMEEEDPLAGAPTTARAAVSRSGQARRADPPGERRTSSNRRTCTKLMGQESDSQISHLAHHSDRDNAGDAGTSPVWAAMSESEAATEDPCTNAMPATSNDRTSMVSAPAHSYPSFAPHAPAASDTDPGRPAPVTAAAREPPPLRLPPPLCDEPGDTEVLLWGCLEMGFASAPPPPRPSSSSQQPEQQQQPAHGLGEREEQDAMEEYEVAGLEPVDPWTWETDDERGLP